MARCDVLLISMPWPGLNIPSLQLGILRSLLEGAGIAVEVRSYYIAFAQYLLESNAGGSRALATTDYRSVAFDLGSCGAGDWVFAVPPYRELDPVRDEQYKAYLQRTIIDEPGDEVTSADLYEILVEMRARVPAFLDRCVDDILAAGPAIVGFTSSIQQNVASLVLAKLLKQRAPHLQIVFGGANCMGPMGEALHRAFPWIDVVVRGAAEPILPDLVRDLLAGGPPRPRPGLCYRDGEQSCSIEEAAPVYAMNDVPAPNYDEYFARIQEGGLARSLTPWLMFESARGCWWGEKQHCTFCGLNGADMVFRSKDAARTHDDIVSLATRYRTILFYCVDNIISLSHLKDLLPALRDDGHDFKLFYETKSNLKKHQIKLMRDAGVAYIQPGIESLSTPILKLMRKGVTAIQNIRLLKWCAQYGVAPMWNLIYGFPGEPPGEYARMAESLKSLTHFTPPYLNRLHIDRFSPYHTTPREFGITVEGPVEYYRHVYDVAEPLLSEISYSFTFGYDDARDPQSYIDAIRQTINDWNGPCVRGDDNFPVPTSPDQGKLTYYRAPGFLVISDIRRHTGPARHVLEGAQEAAYLACDAGAPLPAIVDAVRKAGHHVGEAELERFLRDLVDARVMYFDDGRYLSLALPRNPDDDALHVEDAAPADPPSLVQVRRNAPRA